MALVQDSGFNSLANCRVSCALYAEPLSVSYWVGRSGPLSPDITSSTVALS